MIGSIRARILVLGGVPLLVAGFFMANVVFGNYALVREMSNVEVLMDMASKMSALVHEAQKERGMTAGLLGSKGAKFSTELPEQRKLTDTRREELGAAFASFSAQEASGEFVGALNLAVARFDEIEEYRRRITELAIPASEAIAFYTEHNALMLHAISAIADSTDKGEVRARVYAYVAFLQGKEQAGIERAIGSKTFSADRFDSGGLRRFASLVSAQDTYFAVFGSLATPEAQAFLAETVSGPPVNEVRRMRDVAFEIGVAENAGFGIDSSYWFSSMTEKIDLMKEVEDWLSQDLVRGASVLKDRARRNLTLVGLFVFVLVAGVLVTVYVIAQGISRPLLRTVDLLKDISEGEGDLRVRLPVASRDEIATLSSYFNTFLDKLQRIIGDVAENAGTLASCAEGLTGTAGTMSSRAQEMTEQSETANNATGQASNNITTMAAGVEEVSANSSTVATASEEVSANLNTVGAAVEQMSSNMDTVASASEQMTASVNSVATAIEEMTASLNEVSKSTSQSSQVAGKASETADATVETVNELGRSAQEIGKVVDIITGIAAQTNLLALNATIEAASAGEAGKGFAVVANEVKELAKQTASATEDIRTQVEEMQENTQHAVDAIGQITAVINEVNTISGTIAAAVEEQTATTNEIARNVGEAARGATEVSQNVQEVAQGSSEVSRNVQEAVGGMNDISKNVQEVAMGANEIARNSSEAAQGMNEVAQNVTQVHAAAQETAQGAARTSESAESLAELATKLNEIVGQFKL